MIIILINNIINDNDIINDIMCNDVIWKKLLIM